MNRRSLKRQMQKAQGIPLRRGPQKGTTGVVKGPARSPSIVEARAMARRAAKLAAQQQPESTKAA